MPSEVAAKTLQELNSVAADIIRQKQQRINEYIERVRVAEETIRNATTLYLETGVGYNSDAVKLAFSVTHEVVRAAGIAKGYFQELSKEMDRPLLYAEDLAMDGWMGGKYRNIHFTQLTIPASSRMKGVVAGLTLITGKGQVWEEPITTAHSERLWRFNFEGDKGRQAFVDFCETCRTNPVLRIILKLGPLPREVTNG